MIKSCHNGELNSTQYGTRMTGKGNIAGIIQDQFRIAHQLYLKGRSRPEYNLGKLN